MFKIMPVLYKAKWEAEVAEADLAQLELDYTKKLASKKGRLCRMRCNCTRPNWQGPRPRRSRRRPNWTLPRSKHLSTASSTACTSSQGSLVKEGDILTTLSDNSVMWVYFNVPEKAYLEYMAHLEAA